MNDEQQVWDSSIEIRDCRRRKWKFNYTKHATAKGWVMDWEMLTPTGAVKASQQNDLKFPLRCMDKTGAINRILLEHEVTWLVNHHTNVINVELLKAIQSGEVSDD